MVKRLLEDAPHERSPLRLRDTGEFFDFAARVTRRHAAKLKSYRLARALLKFPPAGS